MFMKKGKVQKLLNQMKKEFWNIDDYQNKSTLSKVREVLKITKKTHDFIITLHVTNSLGFLIGPFLTREVILPFECFRPEWLGYYPLLFYENLTSAVSILSPVLGMDVFFMSIIRLTQIQWVLLNREILTIFDMKEAKKEVIETKIRRCVNHHNFLLEYGKLINETFSISLLLYEMIIVLSMCVDMYVASTVSDLKSLRIALLYCAAVCVALMLCFCCPCQDLTDEADRIRTSIYFSDWYRFPEYAKATMMILMRGQKMMIIEAGAFMRMDLQTGLSTIKTMVSYSMFLRTISSIET
ncbi:hypothetical protein JTB14_006168 [Gonioctena quinquepunctata]|nr:hypothetical protein JTB14_006168 [Gonioctena quinquepunctata]